MNERIRQVNARHASLLSGPARLVFGAGDAGAPLMLIGEAPGRHEEEAGQPFVGQAGKTLSRFLEEVGLVRSALYITNAVKFRPTQPGKTEKPRNRPPTREEIERFRPWLMQEIAAVGPRVIATLGNTPLYAVLGASVPIGEAHGAPRALPGLPNITLFPLYHPASVIYNRALTAVYAEDLRRLRAFCARMFTERSSNMD